VEISFLNIVYCLFGTKANFFTNKKSGEKIDKNEIEREETSVERKQKKCLNKRCDSKR